MSTAIEFEHVSKQYRLGLVSTKTLSHDIRRFWITNVLGKEDPYLKIGETNDRASKGNSEYVWALRDIDFKVEQGDVVGIIGKNGAGKSTLLKLLSRVTGPTTGTIRAHGRIGSLLEVGTGFHGEMTGRENIFMNGAILGMSRSEIQSKLDEIIDFSGCERYIDTPVKRYSSGMTVRLGFAVAAFLEPEILVVDEVLAVGDAEFQKKAIGKMKDVSQGQGRTVLFVSHNMASVRQLCKNGVLLEHGMVKFMGPIDQTIATYLIDDKTFDSVFYPDNNIVQRVSAAQNDTGIEIRLKYKSDIAVKQPNFGFVIFDQYQNPICGTDTLKSGLLEFGEPKREGEIVVQIDSPTLYQGHYYVGIWFGDGKNNQVFANERCLEVDIHDTNFKTVMKNVADEGCVVPNCQWSFE